MKEALPRPGAPRPADPDLRTWTSGLGPPRLPCHVGSPWKVRAGSTRQIPTSDLWAASSALVVPFLQIIWINILLSGDNAVVIALACRDLDGRRRRWAVLSGAGAAIVLRLLLTAVVVSLLALPAVPLLSGALLLWIAVDLLRSRHDAGDVAAAGSIWGAVRTIAIADAVMSLDNVVAVAAAAKGSLPLIVTGIACSVPMIVLGSTLILPVLDRFPVIGVAGAALLGWVAGGMVAGDPLVQGLLGVIAQPWVEAGGAALVLLAAGVLALARRRAPRRAAPPPAAP